MAHLPQIFGIRHSMSHLEAAKKIIDRLPKGSLVGLEMDLPPVHHPLFQKKYPAFYQAHKDAAGFFTHLARHAEQKGHQIVWLDRPAFSMAGQRQRMEQLEALCKPIIFEGRHPRENETRRYNEIMLEFRLAQAANNPLRSRIMSSEIAKRNKSATKRRWRTTDVIITGAIHAVQIAENLSTKVKDHIGVTATEAKKDSEANKREYQIIRDGRGNSDRSRSG